MMSTCAREALSDRWTPRLGQSRRRRREARDSLSAPGESEALGRRRLDADASDVEAGDFGHPLAHRLAIGTDLGRFADERRVEIDDQPAARSDPARRVGEEEL